MAAAVYTSDLVDITLAESVTNWTALGGGASGLGVGADFAMQGALCVDKQVTASEKGQVFNFGSTITPSANTHFFIWCFLATPGVTNTLQNRGLAMIIGTSTTAYNAFHVEGSDTYGAAGRVGKCYPIRYVTTASASPPYRTLTSSPGANPQYFGATANITGTVKSSNLGVDAIRYGTGAYIFSGDVTNPATFAGYASVNDEVNKRWGILTSIGGSYELQGKFVIGQTSANTVAYTYFNDSNKVINLVDTPHSLTNFTQFIIDHSATTLSWTNITIQALGTNNPGMIIFNNSATTATLTTCNFSNIGSTTLRENVTVNGCTWRNCGSITANTAHILESFITNYSGSSNTSAIVWNTNQDTNGYLDNTIFTKGNGTTHAIEFGTSSPTTLTLTNVGFVGYNVSDAQNDSAVHFKRTGGTITLNIIGGTTPSYKTEGAAITIVSNPVSATVIAKDINNNNIQNAQVLVYANSGGTFPYNSTVTISNSGTTATVTHSGHGMSTNDKVLIKGASLQANNGVYTITVTSTSAYTYTMLSSPGSSPTGTIKSTFVLLFGQTDVTGTITMSRVFPTNQPILGRVRKSTTQPYYQTASVVGTVSSADGFSTTVLMIEDE